MSSINKCQGKTKESQTRKGKGNFMARNGLTEMVASQKDLKKVK